MLVEIWSLIGGAGKALGKLLWISPGLLWKRKQAVTLFKERLTADGLEREVAEELAATYRKLGNLQAWLSEAEKKEAGR